MKLIVMYLALISLGLSGSCNSLQKEQRASESINNLDLLEQNPSTSVHLRIDSTLQFSVMVTSIFEDSKRNFWFGSHGDGLCMYDGKSYTYFTAGNGLPMGVDREFAPGLDWDDMRVINGGNQAGGVQEDQHGNIWCESAGKICKFNGKEFLPVTPSKQKELPKDHEWKEHLDYLWFGYPDGVGACIYDGNELECVKFPIEDPKGWDRISAKYIDSKGNMWLGTMDHGTFKYDGVSLESAFDKLDSGISRAIFEDASGRIWFPQNRKSMLYMEDGEIHNFSEEYMKQFPETPKEDLLTGAQTIAQDANGDLWFGMFGGGLFRYDGHKTTHFIPNDDDSLSLCKTIYKDIKGRLLFGLGEGTVYVLTGDSFVRFDQDSIPSVK
ncbi:MAG: hypothetical protein AB8B53_12215 [Flavobacteriales bacterium]